MAAYAALVSLMNTMEQILNHPHFSNSLDKKQAESLGEKINFLLDFIESHNSQGDSKEVVEDLERQIASAAHVAEDCIESHIVDQIHAGSNETSPTCFPNLQRIIVDMDSIKEKVMKVNEERGVKDQPTYSMPAASSRPLTSIRNTTMVGFDDYLTQLLDGLTGYQSTRQIFSIVGMGGIGKTTLARNVYEHLLIVQHFDVRAWVTVSQEYNVREILLETLSCLEGSFGAIDKYTDDELGEKLHKTLSSRRYIIILDDMWSIEAWDKIKFFFPENHNGSRVIVTTRLLDVADQFGSLKVAVNLLDDDESWNLFCKKTFGQEGCPHELEEVGKMIVKNCGGLPLSIIVIGGILGKSSRMQEYWANVAKDVTSILNSGENNECLDILSLSYSHLPACLKPCFLYLGIFPEDDEIYVSRLIKLWVAEGFVRANRDQSLEEIAEGYITDLVDRNLILAHRLGKDGRLKTCYFHDLLRNLCLKIAEKEKFLYAMRLCDTPQEIDRERRLIIHVSGSEEEYYQSRVLRTLESTPFARSLIYKMPGKSRLLLKSRLLRVLVVDGDPDRHYLEAALQQVNLRFFALEYGVGIDELPPSESLLWNVQTFIVRDARENVDAPFEIWEMQQLRHLVNQEFTLPDPPPSDEHDNCVVLRNLQTLQTVENFRCSHEVIKRMPNIKKLKICYREDQSSEDNVSYCLYNLDRLNKLEKLSFSFPRRPNEEFLLQNLTFPSSLRKLHLYRCEFHWNDLTIIGSLPYLEVLILIWGSFIGAEWNPVEGEFIRLKYLEIEGCNDLIYWNADESHFPALENIVLVYASKLKEIPSGIGDIPTLRRIFLNCCNVSVTFSAMKILAEQESLGNQSLLIQFWLGSKMAEEAFWEQMQIEGITAHNFIRSSREIWEDYKFGPLTFERAANWSRN